MTICSPLLHCFRASSSVLLPQGVHYRKRGVSVELASPPSAATGTPRRPAGPTTAPPCRNKPSRCTPVLGGLARLAATPSAECTGRLAGSQVGLARRAAKSWRWICPHRREAVSTAPQAPCELLAASGGAPGGYIHLHTTDRHGLLAAAR